MPFFNRDLSGPLQKSSIPSNLCFRGLGQWKCWCSESGRESSIGINVFFPPIAFIEILGIAHLIIVTVDWFTRIDNGWNHARLSLQPLTRPSPSPPPLKPTGPTPSSLFHQVRPLISSFLHTVCPSLLPPALWHIIIIISWMIVTGLHIAPRRPWTTLGLGLDLALTLTLILLWDYGIMVLWAQTRRAAEFYRSLPQRPRRRSIHPNPHPLLRRGSQHTLRCLVPWHREEPLLTLWTIPVGYIFPSGKGKTMLRSG